MRAQWKWPLVCRGHNARNSTEHSIRTEWRVWAQTEELTPQTRAWTLAMWEKGLSKGGGGQHIKSYIFYDDLDLCADEKLFDITLCSSVWIPFARIWLPCWDFPRNSTLYLGMPLHLFSFLLLFISSLIHELKYDWWQRLRRLPPDMSLEWAIT